MVGSLDHTEYIERLKTEKALDRFQEMSEMDRAICGADQAKHLIIPMSDVYNLRRIAGILHGLATRLDDLSRRQNRTARSVILEVRAEIDDANANIRQMAGKGKKPKAYRVSNGA